MENRVFRVNVSELKAEGDQTSSPSQPVASPAKRPKRQRNDPKRTGEHAAINTGEVRASMHGLVKEILVDEGTKVANGQRLIVFEAMKMESDIIALKDGTITKIQVSAGDTVDNECLLLTIGD